MAVGMLSMVLIMTIVGIVTSIITNDSTYFIFIGPGTGCAVGLPIGMALEKKYGQPKNESNEKFQKGMVVVFSVTALLGVVVFIGFLFLV